MMTQQQQLASSKMPLMMPEDLEGVLELLGMRGPLAGLFQNAIFCVLLVSATIFLGLFVPYNIGRYALWFIAKPMRPVWILYSLCRFIQGHGGYRLWTSFPYALSGASQSRTGWCGSPGYEAPLW